MNILLVVWDTALKPGFAKANGVLYTLGKIMKGINGRTSMRFGTMFCKINWRSTTRLVDIFAEFSIHITDKRAFMIQDRLSWTIWLYKDIGFQGMVHLDSSSPYLTLLKDFLLKKQRLAVDAWGADPSKVEAVYEVNSSIFEEVLDICLMHTLKATTQTY